MSTQAIGRVGWIVPGCFRGHSTGSFNSDLKATLIRLRTPNPSKYGPASGERQLFPYRGNNRCCGHVRVGLEIVNRISDLKCVKHRVGRKRKTMFLAIGFVLLLLWLGGFFVFHVTAFFIHILLILAVVSIIFHFMRGAASAV